MGDSQTSIGPLKYEEIQFFFRKHWTHFVKPLIFGLLVGLVGFSFFFLAGVLVLFFRVAYFYSAFAFLVMIFSIFYINIFFLQIINYFFDLVIVTNHRIIILQKTVFLRNDNDAIDLTKIQDVGVVSHGFLRNYLNYGTLLITLSTSTPPMTIPFAPDPHYYLEQMNRVKREHILMRQEKRRSELAEPIPSVPGPT